MKMMLLIYNECLNGFIQEVKTNSTLVTWFINNKVALGLRKDLILGVVYIPPVGSKYTSVDAFEKSICDEYPFGWSIVVANIVP